VKSPREIAYIRQAAEALMTGFTAAREAARPGRTENDVAAALYHAAISAGSEYMAGPPYVASGPRTGLPHATWAGRTIEVGDLVFVESSANVHRYSAAMFRTWSMGQPSPALRRQADASLAGLDAVLATARPGVTSGDVDAACRSAVTAAGFGEAFVHRTGYSVGVGVSPAWGEGQVMDLKPDDPRPLHAGMVFHIVPVLFPAEGVGIGFSGTILITDDGAELITQFPRDLEVTA
jgi:Xaa-Pro dipeptidase